MDLGAFPEIDVGELARLREAGEPHVLLDVREPWEMAVCSVDGSLNIPMGDIPGRLEELPGDRPLVVMCHHGMRSFRVAAWLRQNGFSNALNLRAGIDAWARQIDPEMPTY